MKSLRAAVLLGAWLLAILAVIGALWLWWWCLQITLFYWGWWGVIIGIALAGIGVVATAIVALIIHFNMAGLGELVLNLGALWLLRLAAAYSFAGAERIKERIKSRLTPTGWSEGKGLEIR